MISREEVLKLAVLARLRLDDTETASIQKDFGEILEYVETLSNADTTGVEKGVDHLESRNVLREDLVRPSLTTAEALSNAPEQNRGLFKVPRVVDN